MGKVTNIIVVAGLATAQAMDMRGLKKANREYLERTQQKPHAAFDEDKYMAQMGKVTRRHLSSLGLEATAENIVAASRHLSYFNESRWQDAEPWSDPEVVATSECPGTELYGSFGTSYICPVVTQVDCATDAQEYASVDPQGNPVPTEGTWNVFPTALRGNWDEPDYWTVPMPMGKFIANYEGMCENGDVFNTVSHPACIPRGVEVPFATMCIFNRVYRIDYNALWYMWYAWSEYGDSAELITRSATTATDGMGASQALYQARVFVPDPPPPDNSRRSLLQDVEAADAAADDATVDLYPTRNILSTAAKGGNIEQLQNMLDTTGLGGSPTLVYPPPTPTIWAPTGNNTNATAA